MGRHKNHRPVVHEPAPRPEPVGIRLAMPGEEEYDEEEHEAPTRPGYDPRAQRAMMQHTAYPQQMQYAQPPMPQQQQVYYQPQTLPQDPETLEYLLAIYRRTGDIREDTKYISYKVEPPSETTWLAVTFTAIIALALLGLTMAPFLFPMGNILVFLACIAFIAILVHNWKKNKDA